MHIQGESAAAAFAFMKELGVREDDGGHKRALWTRTGVCVNTLRANVAHFRRELDADDDTARCPCLERGLPRELPQTGLFLRPWK